MAHAIQSPYQSPKAHVSATSSVSIFKVMTTADRVCSFIFQTISDYHVEEFVKRLENRIVLRSLMSQIMKSKYVELSAGLRITYHQTLSW